VEIGKKVEKLLARERVVDVCTLRHESDSLADRVGVSHDVVSCYSNGALGG